MTEANATSDALMELARERQFDALEAAWMKRLEEGEGAFGELFSVGEYLVRKKFGEQAALLLWSLVAAASEKLEPGRALDAAIRAATIAPEAEGLREEAAALYAKARPGIAELPQIIKASGLCTGGDIASAVALIESCLKMRPGSCVIHARSRRVGRVEAFEEGAFQIVSEGMRSALPPAEVVRNWEPLSSDDFRALVAFDLPRLRQMAREEPARLIECLLASVNGRAEFKQVKFMLIPAVIPAEGWSAWWNAVKVAVKRSPAIEMGTGTQPVLELRKEAATFAEKFQAAFLAASNPYERVKLVGGYVGEIDAGHEADPALSAALVEELIRFGAAAREAGAALAYLCAACELRARHAAAADPLPELRRRAAEAGDAVALVRSIEGEEIARMVLDNLRKLDPERGRDLLAEAFPAGSLRLCEWIARELERSGGGEALRRAAGRAASAPDQYPEAFGWVWRWTL